MEKDFYHSDFEELIREKADQYKMYPSEKVWKGIDRSLRSRRRWYWTGFVLLLSGVSYFAVTDLMSGSNATVKKPTTPEAPKTAITTAKLVPFDHTIEPQTTTAPLPAVQTVTSDLYVADKGQITAAFRIPLRLIPGNESAPSDERASVLISGLEPLQEDESYNIELSWPLPTTDSEKPSILANPSQRNIVLNPMQEKKTVNPLDVLERQYTARMPVKSPKRISWQLAFSPTVNYRKLIGSSSARNFSGNQTIPMAIRIEGDIDKLVNHKPALGFELGTHGILRLGNRVALKGGIQFNYSKYDIRAFRTTKEQATIALNSQLGSAPGAIVSYTDLRNFGGSSIEDLKNQYFQLSMPLGFEVRVFGDDKLQFNVASTIQPTYLLNRNTYLITTDLKNYTKEPSLVRRWNVNTGAEAYVSYTRGDVKWQVGPQFRYQLLSSYQNVYPIKEYLMEYGIKVGITKTIR